MCVEVSLKRRRLMHNGLVNFLDPIAKAWGLSGVHFVSSQGGKRKKTSSKPAKSKKRPKKN